MNDTFNSSEYKNKFYADLLFVLRILIIFCAFVSPFSVVVSFLLYLFLKAKHKKKKAKKLVMYISLVVMIVVLVISLITNIKNVLPNLMINYKTILNFFNSFFFSAINKINGSLNIKPHAIDFQKIYIVKWFLGCNALSFSVYFFVNSFAISKYRTSDEILYSDAVKKLENKHEIIDGGIDTEQTGHVFCIGTTGSGKTANMMHYIEKAFKKNSFVVAMDGKGDLKDFSIYQYVMAFCKQYKRKLYIINQTNIKETTPYNPFKGNTATQVKDMLLSMSEWSEEYYKTQAERYWQCLSNILITLNISVSFKKLIMYSDKTNFARLIKENKEKIPLEFYELASKLIQGEEGKNAMTASARFSVIAEGDGKVMFSDDGFNMEQAYLENAVVLVLLNNFAYNEFATSMGHLIIEDIKNLISSINSGNIPFKETECVFDEISVYVNPQIIGILNRGRSAGIRAIMGTQSVSDIDAVDPALRKQILENSNNFVIMRVNESEGAQVMADTIGTTVTIEQTVRLEVGEYTGATSNKVVNEYIVHPDDIKKLPNLTGYFYTKQKAGEVQKFKTKFVEI